MRTLPRVATPKYGATVPNVPKTPARQMRIPDDEWDDFDTAAKILGTDRAKLVREYIRWAIRRPGAKAPQRLTPEEGAEIDAAKTEG